MHILKIRIYFGKNFAHLLDFLLNYYLLIKIKLLATASLPTFSSSSSSSSSSLLFSCEASSLAVQSRQSRRRERTTSWSSKCSYGTRLPKFKISHSVTAKDHTSLFVVYLPLKINTHLAQDLQ